VAADALRAAVRSQLRFVLPVFGGAALLLLYLVAVKHARFDGATTFLVVSGIALVACLRALYRIVQALARPDLQTVIEQAGEIGSASDRELREERRRLLRALNELRFDHEMGKLSQADYDKVREGYELRAIEVMRRLDAGRGVHPELAKRLGIADTAPEPAPSEVPTDRMELPRETPEAAKPEAPEPAAVAEPEPELARKPAAEEAG
jgi:ribosomal protein L29